MGRGSPARGQVDRRRRVVREPGSGYGAPVRHPSRCPLFPEEGSTAGAGVSCSASGDAAAYGEGAAALPAVRGCLPVGDRHPPRRPFRAVARYRRSAPRSGWRRGSRPQFRTIVRPASPPTRGTLLPEGGDAERRRTPLGARSSTGGGPPETDFSRGLPASRDSGAWLQFRERPGGPRSGAPVRKRG